MEFLNPTHSNLDETCVDMLWYMVRLDVSNIHLTYCKFGGLVRTQPM